MPKTTSSCVLPCHPKTSEIRQRPQTGTALAAIAYAPSCILESAHSASNGWGGARNRADRVSFTLRHDTVANMLAAAAFAEQIGLAFNRHWTVHYEQAGIPDWEGAAFVGRLLAAARKWVRSMGGRLAAVWVRENGDGKGAHVHILLHIPAGLTLRTRTRAWIKVAGGKLNRRVSKVATIGGLLATANPDSERYRPNAENVLTYLLKAADGDTAAALGLSRCGEAGPVIGKRAGGTQNIWRTARARARA